MTNHESLFSALACLLVTITANGQSLTDSIPPIQPAEFTVGVKTVATGLVAPNYGVAADGLPRRLYVVDQPGQLWRIAGTKKNHEAIIFLDLSSLLVNLGIASLGGYDERGFLGLAFSPTHASDGLFYTFTTEPVNGTADFTYPRVGANCPTPPASLDPDHQNVIREWHVPNPKSPGSRPDPTSRVVLRIDWANFNHDGGMLTFGPDGTLFIGLGDGGGEDDQTCQIGVDGKPTIGHSPQGNAQDPSNVYGKILRINPKGRMSKNGQYSVPVNNPFVGTVGFLPEIFAYGLRNPFRFSFDPETGKIMGNDVGQNDIEEVDALRAGNFGWHVKEASFLFDPAQFVLTGFDSDGHPVADSPGVPAGLIDPAGEYAHERQGVQQGHAGIGGFVYRGKSIEELRGRYVFGDYSQNFTDPIGRLLMLTKQGRIRSLLRGTLNIFVLGLGRGSAQELYVMGNQTGIPSGTTGVVQRIVPNDDNNDDAGDDE